MTIQERLKDTETALHIAQVEGGKWKVRAIKLAKFLGIRDCDIDDFDLSNATNGDVIKTLFPNGKYAECKNVIALHTQFFDITCFDKEWWNSPYKKEGDRE